MKLRQERLETKFGRKNMPRKLKAFLDTSAILAGLNSPTGAEGVILAACFSNQILPIISPQIVEESNRNIELKFPKLKISWQAFLLLPPKITKQPSLKQVQAAYNILPTTDAPILASAVAARPDVLVTWNTRHFMRAEVVRAVNFDILTPGEFLKRYM